MWRSYENISGGTCMISAVSVKDRLKNLAKEDGRTMQDELVTYGLERAIYRLSISEYAERFTLKGGIFLQEQRWTSICWPSIFPMMQKR